MKNLTCLAIAITLVFSMFTGMHVTQAAAIYNFYDDFSNGGDAGKVTHEGSSLAPYNIFVNGGTAGVADIRYDPDDETNKVMYMKNTGAIANYTTHTNVGIQFSSDSRPAFPNKTVLEFRFKMPNVYTENKIEIRLPEFGWNTLLAIEDGRIKLANRTKDHGAYVAGKWYTFKMAVIDHTAHTTEFYIDNEYAHTTWNLTTVTPNFQSSIRLQSGTSDPAKPAEIYMDDIKVYAIDATRIISDTQVDVGNTFNIKFNNDIKSNEFTTTYVKAYKGTGTSGEEITGLAITKKPNLLDTYTITFPSYLTAGESYTIAVNGARDIVRNTLTLTHTFTSVGDAPEGLAILSVAGFTVDNTENIVTAVLGFKVSDFISKIVTDALDNKISIIDADEQAVDANAYLKEGMQIKLANADETEERIYSLDFNYYSDTNFDGYTDTLTLGQTSKLPQGFSFGTWNGATGSATMYVQGVSDGIGGEMLKYYLNGASSQMPLLVNGVATTTAKKIMVTEATIKMEDKNSKFILFYVGERTGGTYYFPAVEFNQSGRIRAIGNDIMQYETNKWYKVVSVYDFSTDTGKIYVDGVLVKEGLKSGFFPANQAYMNLQGIRIQKQAEATDTNPSVSYIDDYKCYEIGDYEGFDVQEMMSEVDYTVTSNVLNVKSSSFAGEINGYKGMNAQQLKDSLIKSAGASVELYDASGIITENVAKGNYILVTAPNGRITKQYNLNSETNLGDVQFLFDGEQSDNEYGVGVVTARVDVVSYDKPVNVALVIAQYEESKLVGVKINEKTVEVVGDYIDCSYTVEVAENTTIKCMLLNGMSTIQPLKKEITAVPFVATGN